jgi:regulator of protease activity HflC (stomatin/prohibitin superfamily)
MVKYNIDEAIKSVSAIADDVQRILQGKLDEIQSGIKVSDVRAGRIVWPRQVDDAFQASSKASQESEKARIDATSYKNKLLRDTGGPRAEEILEKLKQPDLSPEERDQAISNLSGQVQSTIADARLDRTRVVQDAQASAEYLKTLLPKYKEYPELVLLDIYQKAIQEVMDNADEKIFIQSREGMRDEIRFLINRNPNIKKEQAENANAAN